jgi:tRNA threonylcarbamoyladenosine biosynthesis protein TsaB
MPMIAEVMAEAGLAFAELDRIAVTVGPGTFTGVRVGVAAARGLALGTVLPVVGATSLAVMAHRARQDIEVYRERLLAVAVDARRGVVFIQLFPAAQGETHHPQLLTPAEAARLIGAGSAILVGSGADAVAQAVAAAGGTGQAHLPDLQPDAVSLAELAPRLAPIHPLRPLYLRPPDAKPQADLLATTAAIP